MQDCSLLIVSRRRVDWRVFDNCLRHSARSGRNERGNTRRYIMFVELRWNCSVWSELINPLVPTPYGYTAIKHHVPDRVK